MKKIYKNTYTCLTDLENAHKILEKYNVIQVEEFCGLIFIEYIEYDLEVEDFTKYKSVELTPLLDETPFDKKTEEEKDLETALDTVLITDPLGKYSGCNLRQPFNDKNKEWIEWVLKNMHNKFIRDKVELIKRSGYGNLY